MKTYRVTFDSDEGKKITWFSRKEIINAIVDFPLYFNVPSQILTYKNHDIPDLVSADCKKLEAMFNEYRRADLAAITLHEE